MPIFILWSILVARCVKNHHAACDAKNARQCVCHTRNACDLESLPMTWSDRRAKASFCGFQIMLWFSIGGNCTTSVLGGVNPRETLAKSRSIQDVTLLGNKIFFSWEMSSNILYNMQFQSWTWCTRSRKVHRNLWYFKKKVSTKNMALKSLPKCDLSLAHQSCTNR